MLYSVLMDKKYKLLIISGKLGDVDGVSLEVNKWISILGDLGHELYAAAGTYAAHLPDIPDSRTLVIPELGFDTNFQGMAEAVMFPYIVSGNRPLSTAGERQNILEALELKGAEAARKIYDFIKDKGIDCLIAQNTNAMPMTLIGAMAVYKLACEYRVAAIFHHHDFWWERSRFSGNHMEKLLKKIMPPLDPALEHVVISSYAAHNLRTIRRVTSRIIPNCEDFTSPPVLDDYNRSFREDLGYGKKDILFLQPTRIVPRKRIEDSIRLVSRFQQKYPELKKRIRFIISLYQGDELDGAYVEDIEALAKKEEVVLDLIASRVSSQRGKNSRGQKLYTNRDVLVNADFVTYLPVWEGFGNALLETVAARIPLAVTTYLVFKTDIMNRGLDCVEIRDDYDTAGHLIFSDQVLEQIYRAVTDPEVRNRMTQKSFLAMEKAFGMAVLRKGMEELLESYGDEILASRKRLAKLQQVFSV